MIAAKIAAATFLSIYALWFFYLAVMGLKRVRDAGLLTTPAKVMGYPIAIVGLVLDVLINLVPMTIVFLQFPVKGEWTLSARFTRHIMQDGEKGWRYRLSLWVCQNFLDAYDPKGIHRV